MVIVDALLFSVKSNLWFVESIVVFLLTWILVVFWKRFSHQLSEKAVVKSQLYSEIFWRASKKPIAWLIFLVGVISACMIPASTLSVEIYAYLLIIRKCVSLWLLTWTLLRVASSVDHKNNTGELNVKNRTRVTTVITTLRLVLFFGLFLLILQSLGYSLSGLVTFGSVGAIVLGFASKTWIENALGYATIRVNKKFELGEWIIVDDLNVEGAVESLSLSSTNLRDMDKRLVSVPNGVFISKHVRNLARLTKRHFIISLPFAVSDREQVLLALKNIKKILLKDDRIEHSERILCNIIEYDAYSSNLVATVDCYLKCTQLEQYYSEKENIIVMVCDVLEKLNLEIAIRKVENV